MPMGLDFFVNLKGQTNTMILPLGVKYSMSDLLPDVSYCSWAMLVRCWSCNENYVSAAFCISSF